MAEVAASTSITSIECSCSQVFTLLSLRLITGYGQRRVDIGG
jgi:hypothetical protein